VAELLLSNIIIINGDFIIVIHSNWKVYFQYSVSSQPFKMKWFSWNCCVFMRWKISVLLLSLLYTCF